MARDLSFLQGFQNGSGLHPANYLIDARSSLRKLKGLRHEVSHVIVFGVETKNA
jgi:hypothetical protein